MSSATNPEAHDHGADDEAGLRIVDHARADHGADGLAGDHAAAVEGVGAAQLRHRDYVPRAHHRICLLPLFFSQMRATQRMQVLQPQIQRIQRKYAARKDPRSKEAMQREIMALQQRHNANPLGSYLLR